MLPKNVPYLIEIAVLAWCLLGAEGGWADDCCPDGKCLTPAWQGSPIGVASIPKLQPAIRAPGYVARVRNYLETCPNCQGSTCHHGGSGVLVYSDTEAGFAQVATVAHIFSEGRGRIVVTFGSREYAATVSHIDPVWDVAVLRIACPAGIRPVRIVTSAPAVGVRLHAGGFPRGGPFRWIAGRLRGWVGVRGRKERWWIQMTGAAQDGDSGGILCDGTGRLIGIIAATDGRMIVGPSWIVLSPHIGPPKHKTWPPAIKFPATGETLPPSKANGGQHTETAAVIAELRQEIAALRERVVTLESQSVIKGPIGPRGPPGESITGPPGKQGPAATQSNRRIEGAIIVTVAPIPPATLPNRGD